MAEFILIIIGVFGFWSLRNRIQALEDKVATLLRQQYAAAQPSPPLPFCLPPIPQESETPKKVSPQIAIQPAIVPDPTSVVLSNVAYTAESISSFKAPQAPPEAAPIHFDLTPEKGTGESDKPARAWSQWERTFIENWTGILGAIILVAGIGFLGIYTALKVEPFWRFVMITAASGSLLGLFYFLRGRETWVKLALWLRSSGGATFLFGCLGSGTIPGLQWVSEPTAALAILLIGIVVNLYFGYVGGQQTIASLHVTLSVVALAIAPQSLTVLIIASAVSAFGVMLAFRSLRWDQHLFVTLCSFAAYHLYWHVAGGTHSIEDKLTAMLCNVLVGATAALVHYQKEYETKVFERLPFLVHMANWTFIGIGTYLDSVHSPLRIIGLAAASIAAFLLARRGRSLGIPWLYVTDTLIAQALAVLAIISAQNFVTDGFMVMALLFVECLVFLRVVAAEQERVLTKVGVHLVHMAAVILIMWAGATVDPIEASPRYDHSVLLLLCLALGMAFHLDSRRRWGEEFDGLRLYASNVATPISVLGILLGSFGAVLALQLHQETYFELGTLVVLGALFSLRHRFQMTGLGIGLWGAWLIAAGLSWSTLWKGPPLTFWRDMLHAGPMLLLAWFVLARRGCDRRFRWLYVIDTLVAQTGALLALLSTHAFLTDSVTVVALLYAQSLAFVWVVADDEGTFLKESGLALLYALTATLAILGISSSVAADQALHYRHAAVLFGCLAAGTGFHIAVIRRRGELFDGMTLRSTRDGHVPIPVSIFGALLSLLIVAIAFQVREAPWFEIGLLGLFAALLYVRSRWQSNGLGIGLFGSLAFLSLLSWFQVWDASKLGMGEQLLHLAPMMVVAVLTIHWSAVVSLQRSVRWPGIYLFGLQAMINTYLLFNPLSPLIPGVAWLLLAVTALEVANFAARSAPEQAFATGDTARHVLHLGYLYMAGFLVRHLLVDLQAEAYIGPVHARLLVEALGMGGALYWWLYQPLPLFQRFTVWRRYQPLYLEVALALFVLLVLMEVPQLWHAITWPAAALILLFLGQRSEAASRIRFYALMFSWVTAIHVAAVSSTLVTPSIRWHDEAWLSGSLAIALLFVFLWQSQNRLRLDDIEFPPAFSRMVPWVQRIHRRKHLWIYYPVVACVTLYLYAGFDKAILTLLWVMEAFAVFVLSFVHKEQHFRYMALAGLGLCLIRLLGYDLAQSNTLTRAVVFLGVGMIMLLMHSVYTKFKNRFA